MIDHELDVFRRDRMGELIKKIYNPNNHIVSDILRDGVEPTYLYCKKCGVLYEQPSMIVRILAEDSLAVKALCDTCKSNGILLDLNDNIIKEIDKIASDKKNRFENKRRAEWKITEEQLSAIIFDEKL